jgi:hypothetical protein
MAGQHDETVGKAFFTPAGTAAQAQERVSAAYRGILHPHFCGDYA